MVGLCGLDGDEDVLQGCLHLLQALETVRIRWLQWFYRKPEDGKRERLELSFKSEVKLWKLEVQDNDQSTSYTLRQRWKLLAELCMTNPNVSNVYLLCLSVYIFWMALWKGDIALLMASSLLEILLMTGRRLTPSRKMIMHPIMHMDLFFNHLNGWKKIIGHHCD